MGSDQSSQHGSSKGRGKNPKRSQSAGNEKDASQQRGSSSSDRMLGNTSPRPSICSDSDIPYISYATSRPISEDLPDRKSKWIEPKPKTREKQINREKRDSKSKSAGSIVIVKAASEAPTLEKNPLYCRLLEIPPFAPIIRGSLKIPWTKDPEISEKISPAPLIRIGLLFEERLRKQAEAVCAEQAILTQRIDEVEASVGLVVKAITERQKKFAKTVDKLNKVNELSHSLSKCHCVLNESLEAIEVLNNLLPDSNRLEPFVWTTG